MPAGSFLLGVCYSKRQSREKHELLLNISFSAGREINMCLPETISLNFLFLLKWSLILDVKM